MISSVRHDNHSPTGGFGRGGGMRSGHRAARFPALARNHCGIIQLGMSGGKRPATEHLPGDTKADSERMVVGAAADLAVV